MGKRPEELLKIMEASAMNDRCFEHMLDFIKTGMTEIQVREEIERVLHSLGADDELAFPTICVSGENSALPHGEPSDKVIKEGEFLTMDFGPKVRGYCGDMTRTVALGYVTEEMEKVYNIVLKSQLAGLAAIKAGVRGAYVDKISRDIIVEAGYGEYFPHGTGHCVGKEVHEPPWVSNRNGEEDMILEENHAVTVEPGIYIPGKFGVRIEDLAIVTDFGIINTNISTKDLIIL